MPLSQSGSAPVVQPMRAKRRMMPAPAGAPIRWKVVVAAAACAALTACGGGGTGAQTASSLPPPPPAPPPPPPPPPVNFDTAEFRRSDGPAFHGADAAWQDGATGEGEIIAVIDTGIDSDSPEFSGRLHPDSQDIAGNRGIDPEDDHGNNVALIAAGGRNGDGVLGIAFDAQVLAIRADLPGTCGTDTSQSSELGCVFSDPMIAQGIDLAIASGAAVINISLGGADAAPQLRSAIARAADAGIVVVVSAGNGGAAAGEEGADPNQPNPFASSLLAAGNGNVIIVGSVNENGDFSDFSNRAGDAAASFLSARGERVCCDYENGTLRVETEGGQEFVTLLSGTSFAAPQVAGAVALLAQAFPNLTGQEITQILLDTARDAGAGGIDAVFGTGILDIAAAFAPQGTTSLAGTTKTIALADDFALGSAAMGDAFDGASLSAIVTDRYDRAYTVELGARARSAAAAPRLRGAVERRGYSQSAGGGGLALAVTIGEGARAAGLEWSRELQLSAQDAVGARVLAAQVAARIAPDTQIAFAMSQSARGLTAQLQGSDRAVFRPAFMIAPEAGHSAGFAASSDVAFATRQQFGDWGVTLSAERSRAWLGDNRGPNDALFGVRERRPAATFGLAADRSWRGFDASIGVSWLAEEGTLLGGHFNSAFGLTGADSVFFDGQFARQIGANWRIGAAYRAGFTQPRGVKSAGTLNGVGIGEGSQIRTEGWSFDVTRRGAIFAGDTIGLRISQPLRVSGGGINFDLPVAYDYASKNAILGRQTLSLRPAGREIMSELNWSGQMPFGTVSASVFYRSEPGHFQNAPDDIGALITLRATF